MTYDEVNHAWNEISDRLPKPGNCLTYFGGDGCSMEITKYKGSPLGKLAIDDTADRMRTYTVHAKGVEKSWTVPVEIDPDWDEIAGVIGSVK